MKPGDSLWRIAERKLGDGFRWKDIYEPSLTYPHRCVIRSWGAWRPSRCGTGSCSVAQHLAVLALEEGHQVFLAEAVVVWWKPFTALAIASGAHPKAIQMRLGHHSAAFTLDTYGGAVRRHGP